MPATDIARIVALGAPVLCLDTCTLLDLMRDPTRESVQAHERLAALDLLAAIESGSDLIALRADQVEIEFREHVKRVEDEAVRAIESLKKTLGRVEAIATAYGGVGAANLAHLDDHLVRARAITDRWCNASVAASEGPDIPSRALKRLNGARTPAAKGKDSMKDCVVIETYLDIVSQLRASGCSKPVVFVSSNVKDYAGQNRTTLKPDLAAEFAVLRMEYAPNFAAAKHQLGL